MRTHVFMLLSLCFLCLGARADVVVIVNANNPAGTLTAKQALDLFMGKVRTFPNGQAAETLDLESGHPARAAFYRALTGKSEAQVDAYWATLVFAGKVPPPKQLPDARSVIERVASTPSAVAFVPKTQALPKSVKPVLSLETD